MPTSSSLRAHRLKHRVNLPHQERAVFFQESGGFDMLGAGMCVAHQQRSTTRITCAPSGAHLKSQPAAWSRSADEQCERARRARGRLPRLVESKNGHDRRGGSRERACAGVVRFGQSSHPCAAGPCKPRGHMQIHAVKVQPPAALGDPYPSLSSGCQNRGAKSRGHMCYKAR